MDRRDVIRAGLIFGATTLTLAACAPTPSEDRLTNVPLPTETEQDAASPVLLAYFSRPGENYYYGDRIDLEIGNTQVVAELIASAITVDVYRIEPVDPYPHDYDETVERNVLEEQQDARPAIANPLPDLSGYDTVLLGCPVWNVQTPMIMRTFVENVDLAGKRLHPFVTYAVSGMGRVRTDYVELLPGTTISEGLAVQGEVATDARAEVDEWLWQIGLLAR